jgi:transcriptional regulator of acetoin/glycerol metabolism
VSNDALSPVTSRLRRTNQESQTNRSWHRCSSAHSRVWTNAATPAASKELDAREIEHGQSVALDRGAQFG